jgi:UDPglucose 6-dehydrogenase
LREGSTESLKLITLLEEGMKIAIIGAGYVGLVSAACFAELGHEVITVDNDQDKIEQLLRGQVPIHEELLPELLKKHAGKLLTFTSDIGVAFTFCDAAFICVGTPPSPDGTADLSYVEGVARQIAPALDRHKVIVEKSTVPVGTCEAIYRTMLLNRVDPESFSIASNPEFLREGTAVRDFLFPDRILLGVKDDRAAQTLKAIYQPILDGSYYERPDAITGRTAHPARLIVTTVKSAELIKHASNAFLALKISYINAVSEVCERVGADIHQVAEGMGADARIGRQFLQAGIGYGGSCFPKDVQAFRAVAKDAGYDFRLLTEVMEINDDQKDRFIAKVRTALWTLRGKKIAVLGLAFKGGTDDLRDSPAMAIIHRLKAEGCSITAFDPAAMPRAKALLCPDYIRFAPSALGACDGADALVVLTEWPEFAHINLAEVRCRLRYPILLDGKNLFNPRAVQAAGITYYGMGVLNSSYPALKAVTSVAVDPSTSETSNGEADSAVEQYVA